MISAPTLLDEGAAVDGHERADDIRPYIGAASAYNIVGAFKIKSPLW